MTDHRFLNHLVKIKGDVVEFKNPYSEYYYWHSSNRIHEEVRSFIKKEAVRKNKLFDD